MRPDSDYIPMVLLKNVESEHNSFTFFCEETCFPQYRKANLLPQYLRMSGKGLRVETTTLQDFFSLLVRSLRIF